MNSLFIDKSIIFRYVLVFLNGGILRLSDLQNTILSDSSANIVHKKAFENDSSNFFQIVENINGGFKIDESIKIENEIFRNEMQSIIDDINCNKFNYMTEIRERYNYNNGDGIFVFNPTNFFIKFIVLNINGFVFWKLKHMTSENALNEQDIAEIIAASLYLTINDNLRFIKNLFVALLNKNFDFTKFTKSLLEYDKLSYNDSEKLTESINTVEFSCTLIHSDSTNKKDQFVQLINHVDQKHDSFSQCTSFTRFIQFFFQNFYLEIFDSNQCSLFKNIIFTQIQNPVAIFISQFNELQNRISIKNSRIIPSFNLLVKHQILTNLNMKHIPIELTSLIISNFQDNMKQISSQMHIISSFLKESTTKNFSSLIINKLEFKYNEAHFFECTNNHYSKIERFILADFCFHIILDIFIHEQLIILPPILVKMLQAYVENIIRIENINLSLYKFIFIEEMQLNICSINFKEALPLPLKEHFGKGLFIILKYTSSLYLKNTFKPDVYQHPEYISGSFENLSIENCNYIDVFCHHNTTVIRFNQSQHSHNDMKINLPMLDINFPAEFIESTHKLLKLHLKNSIFGVFIKQFLFAESRNENAKFDYCMIQKNAQMIIRRCFVRIYDKIPDYFDHFSLDGCIFELDEKIAGIFMLRTFMNLTKPLVVVLQNTVLRNLPLFICQFQNIFIRSCFCDFRLVANENVNLEVTRHFGSLFFSDNISIHFINPNSKFKFTNIQSKLSDQQFHYKFREVKLLKDLHLDIMNFSYSFTRCYAKKNIEILFFYGTEYSHKYVFLVPDTLPQNTQICFSAQGGRTKNFKIHMITFN